MARVILVAGLVMTFAAGTVAVSADGHFGLAPSVVMVDDGN